MGSYFTVVNDTTYPMYCQISLQTRGELTLDKYYGDVVKTLIAAGAVAKHFSFTDGDDYLGLNMTNLNREMLVPSTGIVLKQGVHATTNTSFAISNSVAKVFEEKGYQLLKPGEQRRSSKKTLSLPLRCDCKAIISIHSKTKISTTYITGQTGATDKSNRIYSIKDWQKSNKPRTEVIVGKQPEHLYYN